MRKRPNFLIFITDQHRADHLGCYGNDIVDTRNIDALADRGCVFDNFFVASPLCQPNRASLMTARMPSVHGLQMNGRELNQNQLTFVEMLRREGYQTGLAGKAHLQNITQLDAAWPHSQDRRYALESLLRHPGVYGQESSAAWSADPDFDLTLPYYGFARAFLTIGHADEQEGHWRRWIRTQCNDADRLIGPDNAIPAPEFELTRFRQAWRTRVPEQLYPTRYIADRCCELIKDFSENDEPFFIQCSFPDPHHPFTPPGKHWDNYAPDDMPLPASFSATLTDPALPILALRNQAAMGRAKKSGHGTFSCSEREAREATALNYGNISCIDDAIRRVMDHLAELKLVDDTVVIFTSDHGDMLGDRGVLLKGGMHYRALVRVPFIWCDTPGRSVPMRTNALGQTIDIGVSVLDRAGISKSNGMQGLSLLDVVNGDACIVRSNVVIEEEGQRRDFDLTHRLRLRSLITPDYRLTLYGSESWGELFDLQNDPLELNNLWANPHSREVRSTLVEQLATRSMESSDDSPYPAFLA